MSIGLNAVKSDRDCGLGLSPSDLAGIVERLGVTFPAARFVLTLEGGEGKKKSPATTNSLYEDMAVALFKIQVRGHSRQCMMLPIQPPP